MPEETTIDTHWARLANRDRAALGEVYDRLVPALLGMVLRILPDRETAKEIVENVFVRLWQEAGQHPRADPSVPAWLVITARNAAVERRRSARKLPALTRRHPDPLQKSFSWLPRPEEIALLDQRRELLKKVVNQLPKPQRDMLELAVFEGYTEAEIAAKLGEPLGRAQAALRAGMRFLRHRLRAVLGTWAANI